MSIARWTPPFDRALPSWAAALGVQADATEEQLRRGHTMAVATLPSGGTLGLTGWLTHEDMKQSLDDALAEGIAAIKRPPRTFGDFYGGDAGYLMVRDKISGLASGFQHGYRHVPRYEEVKAKADAFEASMHEAVEHFLDEMSELLRKPKV